MTAALVLTGAVIGVVAVRSGGLRWNSGAGTSLEQAASQRCEMEVMKRLVSPDDASISDLRAEAGALDADGRDFSSLNASEPLKGVDRERIAVWNISGVVNAASEVGSTIRDHFDCRAYFVDGSLAHTLVVFDHAH